jgi:tight adherence protein B
MSPLLQRIAHDPNLLSATVFGGSLLIVGLVAVLWLTLFQEDERRLRRRLERLQAGPRGGRAGGSSDPATPVESVRRNKKDSSIASLDRLIKRLMPNVGILRLRLERSGWRLKMGDFVLVCLGLGVVTTAGMALAFQFSFLVSAGLGIAVGIGLPNLALQRRIAGRMKKFTTLLPEALDLIVRGIRSGLPATEALKTIGEEIQDPVGIEFRQVTDQMKIGVAMDEAMWATAKRLAIPEFNFLVISLSIQQETGGNLAEILEKLSDMVRRREQMRLKVKAMSSEARASAMIIGSLPFIMAGVISFVNPGYMSTLFTDPRGWVMMGMGFTSLAVGLGVMAKMVRFEI